METPSVSPPADWAMILQHNLPFRLRVMEFESMFDRNGLFNSKDPLLQSASVIVLLRTVCFTRPSAQEVRQWLGCMLTESEELARLRLLPRPSLLGKHRARSSDRLHLLGTRDLTADQARCSTVGATVAKAHWSDSMSLSDRLSSKPFRTSNPQTGVHVLF